MKLSLQFHAVREESVRMAVEWARELGMELVAERDGPPFCAQIVQGVREGAVVELDEDVYRISLNPGPVDLGAATAYEHAQRNPNGLYIHFGRQTDDALGETFLSAAADDPVLAGSWKRLRERARRSMHKGAWVESLPSGELARVPHHYYTDEARRLAREGVAPRAFVEGGVRYRFE
jgi:hypothetical protein